MYQLASAEPTPIELMPAQGDRPAVTATFAPQPSPLSLRAARRAAAAEMRNGGPEAEERAGDAFSAAVIRHNLRAWTGIGGADGEPVEPTPDREIRNEADEVTGVEPGTISAFLADPRLFEAADEKYVLPWVLKDAEGNGLSASPSGTGEAGTQADDIASSSATPGGPDDAASAPTKSKKRGRTPARRSGS